MLNILVSKMLNYENQLATYRINSICVSLIYLSNDCHVSTEIIETNRKYFL